jgi:hypothetical protein
MEWSTLNIPLPTLKSNKKMKKTGLKIIVASLILVSFMMTSCEKEGDTPNYVGTWIMEQSLDLGGFESTLENTLVLTESRIEMTTDIVVDGSNVPTFGMKGDLNASATKFTISLTSVGTGNESGGLDWINSDDEHWSEVLAQVEMEESFEAVYLVVLNKLTLTMPESLPLIFTRQ